MIHQFRAFTFVALAFFVCAERHVGAQSMAPGAPQAFAQPFTQDPGELEVALATDPAEFVCAKRAGRAK